MEFLEKVKKIASEVAATSSKQSKKLYTIAKLNLEIGDKQRKVKALYKEIGFEAYKAFKRDGEIVPAIEDRLQKVDSYEETIAMLRKRIDDVKNVDEIGIEDDDRIDDSEAIEADVYDGQSEYDEAETEPIDEE